MIFSYNWLQSFFPAKGGQDNYPWTRQDGWTGLLPRMIKPTIGGLVKRGFGICFNSETGKAQRHVEDVDKVGDYDRNGIPDLMVKFNRKAVQDVLESGEKTKITITGTLTGGKLFQGSDIIKVINIKSITFLIPLALLSLLGLISNKWKKLRLFNENKANEGKSIILITILIGLLFSLGFSIYQWRTTREELLNQIKKNEELVKKIEIDKEKSICIEKIKLPLEYGFSVTLITFRGDITLTRPDGSGKVGRWWDSEDQKYRVIEEGLGGTSYGLVDPGGKDRPLSVGCFSGMMPRDEGDFLVEILKQPDTLPADTYSLELRIGGEVKAVLADKVPFGNFPKHLYIIRSTETEIIPIVPASVGCQY